MAEPARPTQSNETERPAPEIIRIENGTLGSLPFAASVRSTRLNAFALLYTLAGIGVVIFASGIFVPFPSGGLSELWLGVVFTVLGEALVIGGWEWWQNELRKLSRWLLILGYFREASAESVQAVVYGAKTLITAHEAVILRSLGIAQEPTDVTKVGWGWPRVIFAMVAGGCLLAAAAAAIGYRPELAIIFILVQTAITFSLVLPAAIRRFQFQCRYLDALFNSLEGPTYNRSRDVPNFRESPSVEMRSYGSANVEDGRARIILIGGFRDAQPGEINMRDPKLSAQTRGSATPVTPVPPPGDYRFEPVVITPTERRWSLLGYLLMGVSIIVAYGAVAYFRMIPTSWYPVTNFVFRHVSMQMLVVWGGPALVWWLWRNMVRPQYVRIAPGIIQFMDYPWWGIGNPTTRSYSMSAGTLAVLVGSLDGMYITLLNKAGCDSIDFTAAKNKEELTFSALFALLSTSPTPPLSEVELAG